MQLNFVPVKKSVITLDVLEHESPVRIVVLLTLLVRAEKSFFVA